jgi:SPP1 family predicted phage head-tail adaptor
MRERVAIQTSTATRDEFNAEVLSWATTTTVWAKVVERGGREPVIADRPVMVVSYEVTIRSGVTVTHRDRLLWRSKTLAIDTVTPLPADGLIVLRCLEVEK